MNEIAPVEQHDLALLDSLTRQARVYAGNAGMNMIMLGQTLKQAKALVPHGAWEDYVTHEVGINVRWSQFCMACYERYGENEDYAKLGTSKMQIMLALPPGTEDNFMQRNDVESMSTRELREAVKQAREEAKAEAEAEARKEIERERKARRAAEARAEEFANREPEISEETAEELRQKDAEITRLSQQATEAVTTANELRRENSKLRRDNDETEALLLQTQELYDQVQRELHSTKSAMAREDDDTPSKIEFSLESFDAAVGEFMRSCARLPYMGSAFSVMDHGQRAGYEQLLRIVEGWCASSREALNTCVKGEIVIE